MIVHQNKLSYGSWFFRIIMLLLLYPYQETACQSSTNGSDIISRMKRASAIIVVAPHPDDEVLGFAGVIYDALQMGKTVKVVLLTNGEGYYSACYFLKNGFPQGDPELRGNECSPSELERFGKMRVEESKRALAYFGLAPENIITLGYPDGKIGDMLRFPDSVFTSASGNNLSCSGRPITGKNLIDELKSIFKRYNAELVFTTHILDCHTDHNSLGAFIQCAREELSEENILFPVYWAIIHQPGWGDNSTWPLPAYEGELRKGDVMSLREKRYHPVDLLVPPISVKQVPELYFINENLWSSRNGEKAVMRKAIDEYRTQTGVKGTGDSLPFQGYEGWLDYDGFLLSFVKINHLYWEAPLPTISSTQKNPCLPVHSICLPGTWHNGDLAAGFEGSCSCQDEMYCGTGLRIGSGLESGKAWYDIGPFFQDSIDISLRWKDNSWIPAKKTLEIFDFSQSSWVVLATWDDNTGQENDLHVKTAIKPSFLGPLHQVCILVNCNKNARLHLGSIKVD